MRFFTCSYFSVVYTKTFPLNNKRKSELKIKVRRAFWGNVAHFSTAVSLRVLLPHPKLHTFFFAKAPAKALLVILVLT
jgi:hypothetical protein